MTTVHQAHWALMGVIFGYPHCCILSFIRLEHVTDPEPRKLAGTGYVPCKKCNELSEQQLIENINKNRDRHEKPFPLGG